MLTNLPYIAEAAADDLAAQKSSDIMEYSMAPVSSESEDDDDLYAYDPDEPWWCR